MGKIHTRRQLFHQNGAFAGMYALLHFFGCFIISKMHSQEKTGGNVFESGSLALKYKLDNEFELVFVLGYQKDLPLQYLDKLLDEIQLRFRDRFQASLKEQNYFGSESYDEFKGEFEATLNLVEKRSKEDQEIKKTQMRSYKEVCSTFA